MTNNATDAQQLKQASLKDLLNNYFGALGLDETTREFEINQFYDSFDDLYSFKNADLKKLTSYIEKHPNVRTGLMSAIEIGRQIARSVPNITGRVIGSEEFGKYLMETMQGLEQEQLWLFSLDTKHQILATDVIHIGSIRSCPIHLRDIMRRALQLNAQSIIIAHNHPSGKADPSESDIRISNELAYNCGLFEVALLDSFVVGTNEYTSLREHELLNVDDVM